MARLLTKGMRYWVIVVGLSSIYFVFSLQVLCAYGEERNAGKHDRFKWGADFRLRQTYFDNIIDLNDDEYDTHHYFRFRTRFWTRILPTDRFGIYARLTNESWKYFKPEVDFSFNEIVIDNLYLEIKHLLDDSLTLRGGRQDIKLGDGFLIFEGTPLDGSRTIYHNALRAIYQRDRWTINALGIFNKDSDKTVLAEDQKKLLSERDVTVGGVYCTYEYMADKEATGYYFYKEGESEKHPDVTLHTVGARLTGDIKSLLSYTLEGAGQTGSYDGEDREGFGFQGEMSHTFDHVWNPCVSVNALYLSGDDPDTDKDEGWDPVLSRWSKWSEAYIFSLVKEDGLGYWTNMKTLGLSLKFQPIEKMTTKLWYQHFWADENPFEDEDSIFSNGQSRGDLVQGWITYTFTNRLSGLLLGEIFWPGSYYSSSADRTYGICGQLTYRF